MSEKQPHKNANCLYITLHLLQMKVKDISAFRQLLKNFKMEKCNPPIDQLDFDDLVLVHGCVNRAVDCEVNIPKKIKHAWLEFDGCVIENSANNKHIIGKELYYSDNKVVSAKSFPLQEALQNLMEGYGVSFWHNSEKMRKVEKSSTIEDILARKFILEHEKDNHGVD